MTAADSALVVRDYLTQLQTRIVGALEAAGEQPFREDAWTHRSGSGGGISRLIEGGELLERGGVLFSHVHGHGLPPSASQRHPHLHDATWQAMGVSMVLHPRNPFLPTVHMNVRMFLASPATDDGKLLFWFGGGMDLTPYYPFEEDAQHFHQSCRDALAPHDGDLYPRFKRQCDTYFFLKHRNEARGIGGVFFDDLSEPGFDASFAIARAVGDAFLPAYMPIVERRRHHAFEERHREFQAYRRGRYVEFNLVYDRGTLFGLQSGGRTESIFLSMPPVANWRYDWHPEAGTEEARLYDFLTPREWA